MNPNKPASQPVPRPGPRLGNRPIHGLKVLGSCDRLFGNRSFPYLIEAEKSPRKVAIEPLQHFSQLQKKNHPSSSLQYAMTGTTMIESCTGRPKCVVCRLILCRLLITISWHLIR